VFRWKSEVFSGVESIRWILLLEHARDNSAMIWGRLYLLGITITGTLRTRTHRDKPIQEYQEDSKTIMQYNNLISYLLLTLTAALCFTRRLLCNPNVKRFLFPAASCLCPKEQPFAGICNTKSLGVEE
jgi:hypothetical protein